jgi:hypothetical protein
MHDNYPIVTDAHGRRLPRFDLLVTYQELEYRDAARPHLGTQWSDAVTESIAITAPTLVAALDRVLLLDNWNERKTLTITLDGAIVYPKKYKKGLSR